ncbi:MAG: hypothetical protein LWW83_04435 [Azonexaceae bacterium]|nr:hypothetical protein [Azonexaceae bacterium]
MNQRFRKTIYIHLDAERLSLLWVESGRQLETTGTGRRKLERLAHDRHGQS